MTASRPEICHRLVELQRKVEPDLLKIEELKEQLRAEVEKTGEGFALEIPGKGSVEAKAGSIPEFKGLVPVLRTGTFLGLSEARRKKHEADGLVEWKENWSSARKPSITVRL